MARFSLPSPAFDFFQPPPNLDTKPMFARDEEMSVLDDKILDTSAQDMSMDSSRRTSFDQATDEFSRRESVWSDMAQHQTDAQSRHPSQLSTPLFEPVSNPFVRLDAPTGAFAQQQHPHHQHHQQQQPLWPVSNESGSCTPTPIYENFPQEFDGAVANPFTGGAVGQVQPMSYQQMQFRASPPFAAPNSIPMSPQSSQGWVSGSSEVPEVQSRPVRTSGGYRNSAASLTIRRDGIRKKNARFDIPAERTLSNIDLLISQSNDEDEIKELKQQKRLLRNRQAALDSRQRKKVHTEQLEEDKRRSSTHINELQEALQEMKLREAELIREKNEMLERQQQLHQFVEQLHMEKEELIRTHTLETGELRKKNTILREHLERMEMNSSNPSDSGSTVRNDFSDYGGLNMDNPSWESFSLSDEFSLDTEQRPQPRSPTPTPARHPFTLDFSSKKTEKQAEKPLTQSDSAFSWNAFYMCLLFGAFIASNSTSTSQPAIPALSEEYRAESANVLRAVLASGSPDGNSASIVGPSPSSSALLPTTISNSEMAQITSGPTGGAATNLDVLHNNLVAPSKEQEDAQAFAMTTKQYQALTTLGDDEMGEDHVAPPSNLQQAYAAMRNNGLQNRAAFKGNGNPDIYSRSLMWDRVPQKVLQDFNNMVRECAGKTVKAEEPGRESATC
ncbi:TPA_exp: Uncharacterized protein A8136_5503 [Trichophyton benhamiae CBS 112371]|uniref:BZIP domain-containing protein n=1 Tax=Arthroderma benhamiae (strain ATCC MYA-4681 / CBS 112371) TaxID=663331 RepID=D4ANM9_ARTBC|nr:uncharacterized protein ARB_05846 [Trichophyton benhamiae CBS 112371]EFE34890.1 hypothetical protein ARB_05846 [Trichophyton benhamiae CBS 112371]DAA77800.1 TPA_exp: Uncharacterized protein A8136_5503 [Trichophyton benhamiae CBS 112371]